MITAEWSHEEIQKAIDAGGYVEFAPGVYENAHYRISKPVHLVGNGAFLAGGARISWTKHPDGVLSCDVTVPLPIRCLVVNGGLRTRCRLPESGYRQHESIFDVKWMSTTYGGWQRKPTYEELTTLKAKKGDLDGLTLKNAEATVIHSWDDSLLTVQKVEGNLITFSQPGGHPAGGFGVQNYCLWNVPEAFEKAGTFYHDVENGRLYYRPLPGETEETEAYLPEFESVFYADQPVENVEIEGFTITATCTPREAGGFGAYKMTGAIEFSTVSETWLHDLTIRAVGGYGVRTTGQVNRMRVTRCEVCSTGAGGLRVGSGKDEGKSEIADCSVHHVGLYYPAAIGLATVNCHLRRNHVCHTSYSAINCAGADFVVERNLLHDAMEVLNDGAAVYSFGSHRGVLRENLAYGIHPKDGHTLRIAYYLDEQAADWLVERNVAVDCDYPNHNHMCGGHTYKDNIFVNEAGGLLITMPRANSANRYVGNVLSAKDQITITMTDGFAAAFEGNRFHSADGTINEVVLNTYEPIEKRALSLDESNRAIDAVHFEDGERVFSAAGLTIDLTDVGPGK